MTVYWCPQEGAGGEWVASERRGAAVRRVVLKGLRPDEREEAERRAVRALDLGVDGPPCLADAP